MSEKLDIFAWVVPGRDTANMNGSIDAMAWEDGECSCPLVRLSDAEARIAALEAENAKLRAALIEASTRMKNARGAVESNQVADKDVHGTLTRGMFEIAEALGE